MKLALESFIKGQVLSDDDTLAKFTKGRCNVPSGMFESRYKAQMRTLVLSRIMTLVFFLDYAKTANILDKVPRLFTVSSEVKSTRDVLVAICRECLFAEGDIVKHLSRIGLKVSYVQDPVDEVNFKVTNLATDLRDGVLLSRLAEIVTEVPFKSFMQSLRLPAVSRLQKKFNVNFALSKFRELGITFPDDINPHHIMDGHREMVLALMWCIVSHCCMTRLLSSNQVDQEIRDVLRSSRARNKVNGSSRPSQDQIVLDDVDFGAPSGATPEETLKGLLLRWSQAVCSSFGLPVRNFIESFQDGRAICLLINYYHPSLVPLCKIHLFSQENDEMDRTSLGETDIVERERSNWKTASRATQELGGIPTMLPISDSLSPPDEQTMTVCLSYLCSRLMESSKEIFASILIQACYRKYQRRVLLEKKIVAAGQIYAFWVANKVNYYEAQKRRFVRSVAILERFVISYKSSLIRLREARLEREMKAVATVAIQVRSLNANTFDKW
jgi:abnormal spindle-like microcephaly-associated protein